MAVRRFYKFIRNQLDENPAFLSSRRASFPSHASRVFRDAIKSDVFKVNASQNLGGLALPLPKQLPPQHQQSKVGLNARKPSSALLSCRLQARLGSSGCGMESDRMN